MSNPNPLELKNAQDAEHDKQAMECAKEVGEVLKKHKCYLSPMIQMHGTPEGTKIFTQVNIVKKVEKSKIVL